MPAERISLTCTFEVFTMQLVLIHFFLFLFQSLWTLYCLHALNPPTLLSGLWETRIQTWAYNQWMITPQQSRKVNWVPKTAQGFSTQRTQVNQHLTITRCLHSSNVYNSSLSFLPTHSAVHLHQCHSDQSSDKTLPGLYIPTEADNYIHEKWCSTLILSCID